VGDDVADLGDEFVDECCDPVWGEFDRVRDRERGECVVSASGARTRYRRIMRSECLVRCRKTRPTRYFDRRVERCSRCYFAIDGRRSPSDSEDHAPGENRALLSVIMERVGHQPIVTSLTVEYN
jgi:hypothetical protein